MGKLIKVEFRKIEEIEDHTGEVIAYGFMESKKLQGLREKLVRIDEQDGILGNEPALTECIQYTEESIEINVKQTNHGKSAQRLIDDFMPFEAA